MPFSRSGSLVQVAEGRDAVDALLASLSVDSTDPAIVLTQVRSSPSSTAMKTKICHIYYKLCT